MLEDVKEFFYLIVAIMVAFVGILLENESIVKV